MENEVWANIPGYNGYQASTMGRIRSRQKVLKQYIDVYGYPILSVYRDGKKITKTVHRLVAYTFLIKTDQQINHKNGCKTDNRPENLEWCSNQHNITHSIETGLVDNEKRQQMFATLDRNNVLKIKKMLLEGKGATDVARLLNVSRSTVQHIKKGRTWKNINL